MSQSDRNSLIGIWKLKSLQFELADTGEIADAFGLSNADLQRASLRGANLGGALGLLQSQLDAACVDEHTTVPSDLHKPRPCQEHEPRKRR